MNGPAHPVRSFSWTVTSKYPGCTDTNQNEIACISLVYRPVSFSPDKRPFRSQTLERWIMTALCVGFGRMGRVRDGSGHLKSIPQTVMPSHGCFTSSVGREVEEGYCAPYETSSYIRHASIEGTGTSLCFSVTNRLIDWLIFEKIAFSQVLTKFPEVNGSDDGI
jgi:hypothetical protein